MMTEREVADIVGMQQSLVRIERKVDEQGTRLNELEKFADRASGALTLAKVVLSFLGVGGVAAVFAILSRGNL